MDRFIELSHTIVVGMETYPGLPPPKAEVLMDYDASKEKYQGRAEFYIASLHACGNTGTYVDAPIHRYRGGADLAALALDRLADLPFVLVDASGREERAIDAAALEGAAIEGKAVLVRTDFSRFWQTPEYFTDNPFLTRDACELLVSRGARFVGIDSLNIDAVEDLDRPAHSVLLAAGVPICEHMTKLRELEGRSGRLHAVPIAWRGGASFPVRAYVVLD